MSELRQLYASGDYIDLSTDTGDEIEECSGIVFGVSDVFIMLQNVNVWHADGIRVFPLDRLETWHCSDVQKYQTRILNWNGVKNTGQYEWVKLDGYRQLFLSLKIKAATVYVADDEFAEIGEVIEVGQDFVELRAFNSEGVWLEESEVFAFSDIVEIRIDDTYSRVLRAYADANCVD